MTKLETANAIAQDAGTKFVQSSEDASWATKRALPLWQTIDIERRLTEAGIEASIALDNDDRGVAWVYAALDEIDDDDARAECEAVRRDDARAEYDAGCERDSDIAEEDRTP